MTVSFLRELLGSGTVFGYEVLPLVNNEGWYESNGLMLLPASAFFLIALVIWALRTLYPKQQEKD
jgi:Na+-transporting NADH:ubiquinone oxidoreductase subunit D